MRRRQFLAMVPCLATFPLFRKKPKECWFVINERKRGKLYTSKFCCTTMKHIEQMYDMMMQVVGVSRGEYKRISTVKSWDRITLDLVHA